MPGPTERFLVESQTFEPRHVADRGAFHLSFPGQANDGIVEAGVSSVNGLIGLPASWANTKSPNPNGPHQPEPGPLRAGSRTHARGSVQDQVGRTSRSRTAGRSCGTRAGARRSGSSPRPQRRFLHEIVVNRALVHAGPSRMPAPRLQVDR